MLRKVTSTGCDGRYGWQGGSYVQCLPEEMTGHWGAEHYNRKLSLDLIHRDGYK